MSLADFLGSDENDERLSSQLSLRDLRNSDAQLFSDYESKSQI